MATLFNQKLSKTELFARVSHLSQIGGPRSYIMAEGKAKGMSAIEVRTGGGLSYTVLPDRGMDIAWAEYKGIPLGFISKSGVAAPQYYDPEKSTWGDSFYGGLLTTCGLMQVGAGCIYNGRKQSVHGDIANIPAENVGSFQCWENDELLMGVKGTMKEGLFYRENLEMNRTLSSRLGENTITIHDVVTNHGFDRVPIMLLYHMNFGFPMIDKDTVLELDALGHKPGGGTTESDIAEYDRMDVPEIHRASKVFHHDLKPDENGYIQCKLINKALGLGIRIQWKKCELGNFTEWKNLAAGDYVVGLEPCNNFGLGVLDEEKNGTLEFIEPGETREFHVEFSVFEE